jgi:Flp pilus assembly protein TadD/4-amino-4-deoxy-L-arabinose transferase-like glycosyltransferase
LALVVRLLHIAEIRHMPLFDLPIGDGRAFDLWAKQLAAGDWLGSGVFYQAPLYPYLMGILYAAVGRDLLALRLAQALIGAAGCVLLGVAGCRFFGRTTGVLAAVLLALWPSAVFSDGLVQKSAVDAALFCALLALLSVAQRATRSRTWLAVGLTLGALVLTRENALVFAPVLLAAIAVRGREPAGSHGRTIAAAAFLAGLTLVLLPVAARNRIAGGELHLTTSNFGPNLYIGNHPGATGMYRPLRYARGDARYEQLDATHLAERALGRTLSPREVSRYWAGRAVEFAVDHPGAWLRLLGRKAVLLVNRVEIGDTEDQYTYAEWSTPLALLDPFLHFGILVPAAAAGIVLTWPRRRDIALLLVLMVAYTLSVIITFVMARFRHPLLPLLLLFAAAAAVEGLRAVRARRWRPLALAAAVAAVAALPANWPMVTVSSVRASTLYNFARRLEEQPGGLELAIASYRRALTFDPGYAQAHSNLGAALERRGQLDEALVHVRRAVALHPEQGDYHYNLGVVLAARGEAEAARRAYERALEIDPANADAHNNLGTLAHGRGDLDGAVEHYRAALAIDARHVGAMVNLGTAYAQRGELERAIQSFQSAVELDPTSRTAGDNLATALDQYFRSPEREGSGNETK